MRKGIPLTMHALIHARCRHALLDRHRIEHQADAHQVREHACVRVVRADHRCRRRLDPLPVRAEGQCPEILTVPCLSWRVGFFGFLLLCAVAMLLWWPR